jgi:hypothetical protein
LQGSDVIGLAREAESGRIVGFVTAVGDGVLSAFIPLLEVVPDYRGVESAPSSCAGCSRSWRTRTWSISAAKRISSGSMSASK